MMQSAVYAKVSKISFNINDSSFRKLYLTTQHLAEMLRWNVELPLFSGSPSFSMDPCVMAEWCKAAWGAWDRPGTILGNNEPN